MATTETVKVAMAEDAASTIVAKADLRALTSAAVDALLAGSHAPSDTVQLVELLLLAQTPSPMPWGDGARCLAEAISRAQLGRPAAPPSIEEVGTELAWMTDGDLPTVAVALATALGVPKALRSECAKRMLAIVRQMKGEAG